MRHSLGQQIISLRVCRGLSVEETAHMLNISITEYQDIERGVSYISYEMLGKIADIFNMKITDLLKVINKKEPTNILLEDEKLQDLLKTL